jgi:hypothetical protein
VKSCCLLADENSSGLRACLGGGAVAGLVLCSVHEDL